jgi:hypothetical protein
LLWPQIERVTVKGHEIQLHAGRSSVVVNVYCFSEPAEVGRFISSHVPPHVLSTQVA